MIRPMKIEDIDDVLRIDEACFSDRWGEKEFRFEIEENEFSTMYSLVEDNLLIGFAGYYKLFENAEVLTLAIDPKYQSKGYGEELLKYIIKQAITDECEVISLEVRVSNYKAIKLYEKYGFITMRTRKDYYPDNHEDAFEMMKAIGGLNAKDICD